MGVFGGAWKDHADKLAEIWKKDVSEKDIVIVVGDISWAMKTEDAIPDLDFLHRLPGKKLLIRGNHDLWWQGINKLNMLYEDMIFLQNDYFAFDEDLAICGSRGWGLPGLEDYGKDDEKILKRELIRLKFSLEKAINAGFKNIICALHFPPALTPKNSSPFTELISQYPVSQVVYGHLHGQQAYKKGIIGIYEGIKYSLVSGDYLGFKPLMIM
jgi:predicted phosphohydrolase